MSRRLARELALQALFQIDVGKTLVDKAIEHVLEEQELEQNNKAFFVKLVNGVREQLTDIDQLIAKHLIDWEIARIANVDRNILRIATYEMTYCPDIPSSVSINEAVELAKIFSSDDSPKFINGVLDSIDKKSLSLGIEK